MKKLTKTINYKSVLQFTGLTIIALAFVGLVPCDAQQINQAIQGATTQVKGIFDSVSTLILVIGAVVGLAGAIRVYVKWQNGDPDVQKHLVGWLGACIFLLLTGVILKTFFGI